MKDFHQIAWDAALDEDCRQLIRLAIREDLEREQDWTTLALVPQERRGAADIVARQAGIVAGMPALTAAIDEFAADIALEAFASDGQRIERGSQIARISGKVRDLLTAERTLLNFLGRLMGIATLASSYVEMVGGTGCRIYDTRKTTPGWRRLEKYAVRCGGACNHRLGLYDAILIKDNHLAQSVTAGQTPGEVVVEAVRRAKRFITQPGAADRSLSDMIIEVEVDSIEQLSAVLSEGPHIVLLDNMPPAQLHEAVLLRNDVAPQVQLEASGGVTMETLRQIAASGVDRISIGALTHSAKSLDVGLDWHAS